MLSKRDHILVIYYTYITCIYLYY